MTTPDRSRIYETSVTVPANTLPDSPQVTPWATEDNDVTDIEIEIPPGHNGLTGIRIMKGDVQLIPFGVNSWLIANNYDRVFPVGQFLPTADVKIQAYNQGVYSHTFYLRMAVTDHHIPSPTPEQASASALSFDGTQPSSDPLSPDALIGPGNVAALSDGTLTAADLEPVTPPDLTIPPPAVTG